MDKALKYTLALLFTGFIFLTACHKEVALTPDDITETYIMTPGSNVADTFRYKFFNKYQTKILFDFNKRDYWYSMNSSTTVRDRDSVDYFSYITDTAQQRIALQFLNTQWLLFYPDSLKQANLPQYIFAVDRLYDYATATITATTKPDSTKYFKTNDFASLVATALGSRFSGLTTPLKVTLRNELHYGYLYNWIYLRNKAFFPSSFYAVSSAKYGAARDSTPTTYKDYSVLGLLPPVAATYPGYTTTTKYQTQDDDVAQYLRLVIQQTQKVVDSTTALATPIKTKYDILVNYFTSMGINIRSINTYDATILKPLTTY